MSVLQWGNYQELPPTFSPNVTPPPARTVARGTYGGQSGLREMTIQLYADQKKISGSPSASARMGFSEEFEITQNPIDPVNLKMQLSLTGVYQLYSNNELGGSPIGTPTIHRSGAEIAGVLQADIIDQTSGQTVIPNLRLNFRRELSGSDFLWEVSDDARVREVDAAVASATVSSAYMLKCSLQFEVKAYTATAQIGASVDDLEARAFLSLRAALCAVNASP